MANIYDHVSITINIKSDYSSDIISFTCAQCLLKKKGFCEENLVQNTQQPGMLKKCLWHLQYVFYASPNVQTHRSNMHTDSLSLGLNNQKTISITILQCSDNHDEEGES